jgi:putative toxin-antitoxin system antitoxin component (TIGR02293 family)
MASNGESYSATARHLGVSAANIAQLAGRVEVGFPYAAIDRFHKISGMPIGSIAEFARIPKRTLIRRRAGGKLNTEESERLLRLSTVFEKAVGLFEGDARAARRWLATPSMELDNRTPLDFARTEFGAREVEDLIGRLEHGVFT